MEVAAAEKFVLDLLHAQLSERLYYHGIHHTQDVEREVLILANEEGIQDQESLNLLKTAALYHDCGFVNTYREHEAEGCRIARNQLPLFGYSASQIEMICGMIMATKIPQTPNNHLEMIICDADLDYLGRDDFEPIAATLFKELEVRAMVSDLDSWNRIQVKFLEAHQYHTRSAQQKRELPKQEHLNKLRQILKPML
jgi:uncharacterized protein